jgi:hypothetical protein
MPKVKQMVKRAEVEIAKAKRTCKFTKDTIVKGTACLVVYEGARDRSCYSLETAGEMIKAARVRLDELETTISTARNLAAD